MEVRLSVCSGTGHMLRQAATCTVMSKMNEVAGDKRSSLFIKNDRKNTSFWWGQQDFRVDVSDPARLWPTSQRSSGFSGEIGLAYHPRRRSKNVV
jgi:hypothetical protein